MKSRILLAIGVVAALVCGGTILLSKPGTAAEPAALAPSIRTGTTYALAGPFTFPVAFQAERVTLSLPQAQLDDLDTVKGPWQGESEPERITADYQQVVTAILEQGTLHETSDSPLENPCLAARVSTSGLVTFQVIPSASGHLTTTESGDMDQRDRRYWVTKLDMESKQPTVGDLSAKMPKEKNQITLDKHGNALAQGATLLARVEPDGSLLFLVGSH